MTHDPAIGTRETPSYPRSATALRAPWENPHWEDQVHRDARNTEASARATVKRTGILAGIVLLLVGAGSTWVFLAALPEQAPNSGILPREAPLFLAGFALAGLAFVSLSAGFAIVSLARQSKRLGAVALQLAENQVALARGAAETAEIARGLRWRLREGAATVPTVASAHPAVATPPAGGERTEADVWAALRRVGVVTQGDLLFWDPRALSVASGVPLATVEALRGDTARALQASSTAVADGSSASGVPR